jgi:ATP-dependent RNA helicase RhlB
MRETMSENYLSSVDFSSLDLEPALLEGLQDLGFDRCTPIQAATLPDVLRGHDVAGQAQTGTGKTIAFLLGTFHRLLRHAPPGPGTANQPRALIMAPTRELAIQIHRDAQAVGRHAGLRLALAYGGTGYTSQRERLEEGTDILVGTPGRLIDYLKQKVFDLRGIEVMVLDEADRMFDLGFIKDIRFLLRRMPRPDKRLGMLFSATLSHRVMELAYEHMNNPRLVRIEPDKPTVDTVRQRAYYPANAEKIALLIGLLRRSDPRRSIVFVNTKAEVERVCAYLRANRLEAAALSGDVPQTKRQSLLKRFQEGELPVLVATDVAARGLHIPDVSHVFNYDLPQDAEDYVHRIGRTARAGASGDAISFACEKYAFHLPEIEDYIGYKIEVEGIEPELLAEIKRPLPGERKSHRRGRSRHHGERRTKPHRSKHRGERSGKH